MSEPAIDLEVLDGPDKPALLWALTYPDREQVHFKLADGGLDARIVRIDEMADGLSFRIMGIVESGPFMTKTFEGVYSVANRTGSLSLRDADPSLA